MADNVMRGKVVHFKCNDEGRGYHGFIREHGCADMTRNIRFTDGAVEGMSPALGDTVAFVLSAHNDGDRRNCQRIWRVR